MKTAYSLISNLIVKFIFSHHSGTTINRLPNKESRKIGQYLLITGKLSWQSDSSEDLKYTFLWSMSWVQSCKKFSWVQTQISYLTCFDAEFFSDQMVLMLNSFLTRWFWCWFLFWLDGFGAEFFSDQSDFRDLSKCFEKIFLIFALFFCIQAKT